MSYQQWVQGAVVASLIAAVYFTVWQTARTAWVEQVAHPVFEKVASTVPERAQLRLQALSVSFQIGPPGNQVEGEYRAPPGVKLLLPLLFIVLIVPSRPYWLYFWLGHLCVNAASGIVWILALLGWAAAPDVATFVGRYVVDAYSLTFAALVFVHGNLPVDDVRQDN